jgi:hypothetical protein
MIILQDQPTLTDLHGLIDEVPSYPVSVRNLIDIAIQRRFPKPVIDFYKLFPDDENFNDKDDLLSTTESVEMLQHQTAPTEGFVPEED